jgi:hypothetical protein
MTRSTPHWENPDALRSRAQWYRDFAKVCSGDNSWCLNLAQYFDRMASEIAGEPDRAENSN